MSSLKNVVLIGASSNLGAPILEQFKLNPGFAVTILARPSTKPLPRDVKVTTVPSYDSKPDLVNAFRGAEAVIFTGGPASLDNQTLFVDAAIEAGVKRFISGEFGSNLDNPNAASMNVFQSKVKALEYLRARAAEGKITWTGIRNSVFFDWGLRVGFCGVNAKEKTVSVLDGGKTTFSTTLLDDVAKAVVGVLKHPKETENRPVFVESTKLTGQKMAHLAEQALGTKFEVKSSDSKALLEGVPKKLKEGDMSWIIDELRVTVFGPAEYGSDFADTGVEQWNEMFGIKQLTEEQQVEVFTKNLSL